ncbi:hypothetical protein [Burkholderia gladioli]|uniref:hypothetical protein n=1 Tax=Burkholderia gladioli TaxID=28095 RepID=UPI001640D968|nr:hypothetical protein [Burkholderia gladioli]
MSYTTEVVRKVYDEGSGHAVSIGPSADFPGNVMLYVEKPSIEYFGGLRLDVPAEMMRQIGEALIAAADEAEGLSPAEVRRMKREAA